MEELLWFVFAPIIELLGYAFTNDDRPAARTMIVGCGVLVLLIAVTLGIIFLR